MLAERRSPALPTSGRVLTTGTPDSAADVVHVSLSFAFLDKSPVGGRTKAQAFAQPYEPRALSVQAFAEHVLAGRTWLAGIYDQRVKPGGRSNEAFQRAELVCLDFDQGSIGVQEALQHPLIRRCALLVHPSASSTPEARRTRVIFRLAEPVEGGERYRALVQALGMAVGLVVDPASAVPAQCWHGSRNRSDTVHFNPTARLDPASIAGELVDQAAGEMLQAFAARERVHVDLSQPGAADRAQRAALARLERAEQKALAAPKGERHDAFKTFAVAAWKVSDWRVDVEPLIEDVGRALQRTDSDIRRMLRWVRQTVQPEAFTETPRRPAARRVDTPAPIVAPGERPAAVEPEPMRLERLWQFAPMMATCPEAALIAVWVQAGRVPQVFSATQLAEMVGCSVDTAQRWIKAAVRWEYLDSANFTAIESPPFIPVKNAAGPHYRLTLRRGYAYSARHLPDRVHELLEASEAGSVDADELEQLGAPAELAAPVAAVTAAASLTAEAFEVSARVERQASRRAEWLLTTAEIDETALVLEALPEASSALPTSVAELRAMLLQTLITTDPDREWPRRILRWLVGVKTGSVGALLRKTRYQPAAAPTFKEFPLPTATHKAVREVCRREHGAPVAWVTPAGDIPFGRSIPAGVRAVRLNVGKRMEARAQHPTPAPRPPVVEPPAAEPAPTPARVHRRDVMRRLAGCLLARGWQEPIGPYGVWTRGTATAWNDLDGMLQALSEDYEWAQGELERRRLAAVEF